MAEEGMPEWRHGSAAVPMRRGSAASCLWFMPFCPSALDPRPFSLAPLCGTLNTGYEYWGRAMSTRQVAVAAASMLLFVLAFTGCGGQKAAPATLAAGGQQRPAAAPPPH